MAIATTLLSFFCLVGAARAESLRDAEFGLRVGRPLPADVEDRLTVDETAGLSFPASWLGVPGLVTPEVCDGKVWSIAYRTSAFNVDPPTQVTAEPDFREAVNARSWVLQLVDSSIKAIQARAPEPEHKERGGPPAYWYGFDYAYHGEADRFPWWFERRSYELQRSGTLGHAVVRGRSWSHKTISHRALAAECSVPVKDHGSLTICTFHMYIGNLARCEE